jgi:cobalt/nickel transport system permease protein
VGRGHAHALHVHGHSAVHRLPAEAKIVAAVLSVLAVAVTPREAFWAYAGHAVAIAVVVAIARLRPRFVLTRMLVIAPFLLAAVFLPFVASGDRIEVVGVSLAVEGLWGTWSVTARASIGVATSIVLAATTEVPRLLRGLERLHVPRALTQIATFMVRYLEVVAGELGRQRRAMSARGYDPRWFGQVRPLATSAGALFVRSFERGERVHAAMLARGYDGTMPTPAGELPATARQWARAALLPAVSWSLALAALAVTP